MNSPERIVRRANVDDLPGLKLLWERAYLQVLDLEKRLTEFQLIASPEGDLIGAIALQVDGKHGRLHSEAFTHPELADDARPWLWHRIQTLARNQGLVRLWTLESSPFWNQAGFIHPDPDLLKLIPTSLGDRHNHWLTLALREDNPRTLSIEREFEIFQQAQRANTEEVLARARKIKTIAYLLTLIVTVIALVGLSFVFFRFFRPQQQPAADRIPRERPNPKSESRDSDFEQGSISDFQFPMSNGQRQARRRSAVELRIGH